MDRLLTSGEAAALLNVDRTTTFRAASSGKVAGAKQEPRHGSINDPWVASEAAWRDWDCERRPAGRPLQTAADASESQPRLLSRADYAVISRAEWVPDQKDTDLFWWTVWTDKTCDTAFRVAGSYRFGAGPLPHPWENKYTQGTSIQLADLSFLPRPTGIMAYADSERGVVLATIGKIRDQLEPHCGPLAYLKSQCMTRRDTVAPSEAQMAALETALGVLMNRGVKAAMASLNNSGLFTDVFQESSGCPNAPARLPNGVFEWR